MGLFWRRKKDDFVSLRLNEPAEAVPEPPPPPAPSERPVEPPVETIKDEVVPSRSPFQSSVLGLNRSMEELQAQEAALEQEFSARFRRAVAATRESLSDKLDTVFAGRKQIDEELLEQLEEVLIAADIGVPTTLEILETVRRGIERKQINDLDALKTAIKTELLTILQASERQGIASELTVPETVAPYVGAVNEAIGAVVSGGDGRVVPLTTVDLRDSFPAASKALTA